MKITFRDDLGIVTLEVHTDDSFGITFDGRYAYFSDVEGRDYRIPVKDIVLIGEER